MPGRRTLLFGGSLTVLIDASGEAVSDPVTRDRVQQYQVPPS